MSNIHKKRISAVRVLEVLGYTFTRLRISAGQLKANMTGTHAPPHFREEVLKTAVR